jgi:hypothetical protein
MRPLLGKRPAITVMLAVVLLLIMVIVGMIGFVGLRSTEIVERIHTASVAAQLEAYPDSVLVAEGYKSLSHYVSDFQSTELGCTTNLWYRQIFYADAPIDDIQKFYEGELSQHGWVFTRMAEGGIIAKIDPHTAIYVNEAWTGTELPAHSDINLASLIEQHQAVYVIIVEYAARSCFQVP